MSDPAIPTPMLTTTARRVLASSMVHAARPEIDGMLVADALDAVSCAIRHADLVVVNGVGPGIKPRLRLLSPTGAPRAVADAALLADVHALLARVAERLR